MKKKNIILLSILLFSISFLIILINGQKLEFNQRLEDLENIDIYCTEDIIICNYEKKDNYVHFNISSKKPGKAEITFTNNNKHKNTKLNIFVHRFGIITLGSYFGYCNGDIYFIASFYIIMVIIVINLIKKYRQNIKSNLYSYENSILFGLIIFITIPVTIHLFFFVYDLQNNYHNTIQNLIFTLYGDKTLLLITTFPAAAILTILVTISNLELLKKEGKRWTNMLGIILGGFFLLSSLSAVSLGKLYFYNIYINIINDIIILFIAYLECVFIGTCISGYISAKHIPKFDKDYIIILGCKIKEDGNLTLLLQSRVDKAIEFSKWQKEKNNKDIIFIASGGKGNDEVIPEAKAIEKYLLEQGIKKEKILIEDQSTNTYENIKFSNEIIKKQKKDAKIAFSTTNYHVFRAGIMAKKQNIEIEGIGAKTKSYYWVNAFIREFVAILKSEKKSHIKILIALIILGMILFIISKF